MNPVAKQTGFLATTLLFGPIMRDALPVPNLCQWVGLNGDALGLDQLYDGRLSAPIYNSVGLGQGYIRIGGPLAPKVASEGKLFHHRPVLRYVSPPALEQRTERVGTVLSLRDRFHSCIPYWLNPKFLCRKERDEYDILWIRNSVIPAPLHL